MERSLYPEGCVVNQNNLARTESTRAYHILQRADDATTYGVVSGCEVTPNIGDGILVDINTGYGYAPNGELIEITTAVASLILADYTNSVINYAIAFYTEINDELEAHETNGNSYPTAANGSYRLDILSATEYAALPSTDGNFNNNALDRALILAKITAKGVGVALTSSDVVLPTIFGSAITATNTTNTISGVGIYNIDRTTPTGIGQLNYTASTIGWKSPGDSLYGAYQGLTVSGLYTLTSNSDYTIIILVVISNLPATPQTDNIQISNIYAQSVNRYTPEDIQHRSLIGSGTPTTVNPHGMTPEDLGITTDEVEVHQDLFHSNGILKISKANVFTPVVNSVTTPDSINVTIPDGVDTFYINGVEHNALSSSTILFSDVVTEAGTDVTKRTQAIYSLYVLEGANGIAFLTKARRMEYNEISNEEFGSSNALANNVQLRNVGHNLNITTCQLQFLIADYSLSFKLTSDISFGPKEFLPATIPTVLRLYNETREYWIEVYANDIASTSLIGNQAEQINVLSLPGSSELETRLLIGTVMFSGWTPTGAQLQLLGNGFRTAHNPNTLVDYGTLKFSDKLQTITGIRTLEIDKRSNEGRGILTYTTSNTSITWAAPGDIAGGLTNINIDNIYPLSSNNGQTIKILKQGTLPSTNKTDTVLIRKDEQIFGTLGRDDVRGDVDSILRDVEDSRNGIFLTKNAAKYTALRDRLQASGHVATVGTGYGGSIGDYNVKDFVDAATCINTIINELTTICGGGTIVVKPGTYLFNTSTVVVVTSNISIVGENPGSVIFEKSASATSIISTSSTYVNFKNIKFSVIGIVGAVNLISITGDDITFEKCVFNITANPSGTFRFVNISSASANVQLDRCKFSIASNVTANVIDVESAGTDVDLVRCWFSGKTTQRLVYFTSLGIRNNLVECVFVNMDQATYPVITSQADYGYIVLNRILGSAAVDAINLGSSALNNIVTHNFINGLNQGVSNNGPYNIIDHNMCISCQQGGVYLNASFSIVDSNMVVGLAASHGIFGTVNAPQLVVVNNLIYNIGAAATAIECAGTRKIISGNYINVPFHGIVCGKEESIISSNFIDSNNRGIYVEYIGINLELSTTIIGNVCLNQTTSTSEGAITIYRNSTTNTLNATIAGNVIYTPNSCHGIRIASETPSGLLKGCATIFGNSITIPNLTAIRLGDNLSEDGTDSANLGLVTVVGNACNVPTGDGLITKGGSGGFALGYIALGNALNTKTSGIGEQTATHGRWNIAVGNSINVAGGSSYTAITSSTALGNHITQSTVDAATYNSTGIKTWMAVGNRINYLGNGSTSGNIFGIVGLADGAVDLEKHQIFVANSIADLGPSSNSASTAIMPYNSTSAAAQVIVVINTISQPFATGTDVGILVGTDIIGDTVLALNIIDAGITTEISPVNVAGLFPDHSSNGPVWDGLLSHEGRVDLFK